MQSFCAIIVALTGVGSRVPLQIERVVEAFEAEGAEVFLVTVVRLQVSNEPALHVECLPALLALPTVANFLACRETQEGRVANRLSNGRGAGVAPLENVVNKKQRLKSHPERVICKLLLPIYKALFVNQSVHPHTHCGSRSGPAGKVRGE